ncbi:maleate cis-trans isomerase family protein [Streptomyces tropicalis]|uniref:Decarboxylase n=1 Tax=Streptomyces tropicalis TaxID=3034234 RepID=A0ABT5ZZN6_9ACTN|nr:aspartate/glutamate racemase family protein [Streptomyces tropicalis]MDF3297682.1 decarboxylase [Streptomyces tropicalis]
MTALGVLYPGHLAEDDYPRIEQLLGSDIRVDLVHTPAEDPRRASASRGAGGAPGPAAGVEGLRLSGAEAVVSACSGGGFADGWDGAHERVRSLARAAGMPASATAFAFVHAAGEVGARRVAVATTGGADTGSLVADFLRAAGLEVVAAHGAGPLAPEETAAWGETEILALAREADTAGADAVLLTDTALHTASHLTALEKDLGKPVLTAHQVTVWEGLRLTDRRVNAPALGALFTREPIVQA